MDQPQDETPGPPHQNPLGEVGDKFTVIHTKFESDPKLDDQWFDVLHAG